MTSQQAHQNDNHLLHNYHHHHHDHNHNHNHNHHQNQHHHNHNRTLDHNNHRQQQQQPSSGHAHHLHHVRPLEQTARLAAGSSACHAPATAMPSPAGGREQQQQQHRARASPGRPQSAPAARAVDLRIPAIEKYAYCLCLHVKPTTLFIAVFKLTRALLFASILLNSEFSLNERAHASAADGQRYQHRLPLPAGGLGGLDERDGSAALGIMTRVLAASVSALGVYSVISGRSALLIPLYANMLVDFFFALPAFYNRDFGELGLALESGPARSPSYASPGGLGQQHQHLQHLQHQQQQQQQQQQSSAGEQYARYSLTLFSTIIMVIEIYFLCVVGKCYRYLRLIELIRPIGLSELYSQAVQRAAARTGPGQHQAGGRSASFPVVRVLGVSGLAHMGAPEAASQAEQQLAASLAPPPYDSVASAAGKPPNYEEAMKSCGLYGGLGAVSAPAGAAGLGGEPLALAEQAGERRRDTSGEALPPPPQYVARARPEPGGELTAPSAFVTIELAAGEAQQPQPQQQQQPPHAQREAGERPHHRKESGAEAPPTRPNNDEA